MTDDAGRSWVDEEAGPLIRPYAMTKGRTRAENHELDLITLVVSTRPPDPISGLSSEHERIVEFCGRPISVAEVAANLDVPLMVAKVLLSDLMSTGAVIARPPIKTVQAPDRDILQAVLDGIRRL